MQGAIIKQLTRLPTLNAPLTDYIKRLIHTPFEHFSLPSLKTIAFTLIATTCQTRNLLHYRHLQQRSASEKCLTLISDLLSKMLKQKKELLEYVVHEFTSHIMQHPSCYISYAFFYQLVSKQDRLKDVLQMQRLRKVLHKIASCFEQAGELKFIHEIAAEKLNDWEQARNNLQAHLAKKYKPLKQQQRHEEVTISQSKIPPLILPLSKSINSSRYSAISREERTKGLQQLRQLASAMGQGFIAVQLGCLLAHKRTQQVQQFSDNSDYRNKCLEKIQTDRVFSSRLSMMQNSCTQNGNAQQKQMDETNRKYYRKSLTIHTNIIHLSLANELKSKQYDATTIGVYFNDYMELSEVGIVDSWDSGNTPTDYFSNIKIELLPVSAILSTWGERISFITEKKHLRMLWNRNKKNNNYFYQEERVAKTLSDQTFVTHVSATRYEHLKLIPGAPKNTKKNQKVDSDLVISHIGDRLNQLFSLCDMNNTRFYKYEVNLLAMLANYLHHSFSSTVQYLCIDLLFPLLLLIKRQLIELSHPLLENAQQQKTLQSFRRFSKKQKMQGFIRTSKQQKPLITAYPQLMCNFLLVISGIMSNQKHVQKLISTVFLKNIHFMQTLQRYMKYLFQNDLSNEIKKVLAFYRRCLEIYNQRKLRYHESKSIKILFNHLSLYFYPKLGCIANKIEEKQHLISASPDTNDATLQGHHFLHELLEFIKDVYYYCQDDLSDNLLEEEVASFYIKYSLVNFIKLYSSLTVSELISLQEGCELTTKQSPHVSYHPSINTIYMIDFVRILTSISINRTNQISKKIKQYRILQFFIREFELEFQVAENIQKYIKKVGRSKEVPQKLKPPSSKQPSTKQPKIPALNLKSQKYKAKTTEDQRNDDKNESKNKKQMIVPSLKLPTRSDTEGKEPKGVMDSLLAEIKDKPKTLANQFSLQLTKLNLDKNGDRNNHAKSSERNLIYTSQRRIRKIYSNKTLHSEAILLVLSLLLNKGLLDPEYCDQFPVTHGKINVLYVLHHHLNEQCNRSVIPILAEAVGRIKPFLCGQRLLKLLSTSFTDLNHYRNWKKINSGAYGVIYSCTTHLEQPRQVAIKEMNFPKSIYERCVLHDIFTQISCLENFRLDDRISTMYNYGVVGNNYVIVMKRYDCSLRDWVVNHKHQLTTKINTILKLYWEVLNIILLLHETSVTHYDIKADNILLQLDHKGEPVKAVLGDFGECRIFDHSKEELDMKSRGTECIKSPEMLTLALHLKKQADNYDRRKKIGTTRASDIWSMGCLFYEMLTGEFLYHRADWVNFYVQVTSTTEDVLNSQSLQKLQGYSNYTHLVEYLRCCLVRDPQHRPQIKSAIQKFRELFGDMRQAPLMSASPLVVQKDVQNLVSKYMQQMSKHQQSKVSEQEAFISEESGERGVRGKRFIASYNQSRSNKFMRIMEDIFFCDNINLQEGGYHKMKELKITHVVTTQHHPLLLHFNTLQIAFQSINLPSLAFRLSPRISDLLREVLLLKGRLLFINDSSNYATNLLIYTLSYWFRCSVYQTWCLINTQILLFPAFTSDLLALSSALRILNDIQQRVQELPKLQCICGSVTFILKELNRTKKRNEINCRCKKKKNSQFNNFTNGPECVSTGCQQYLDFVKKRYSISWQSIKWATINTTSLLTSTSSSSRPNDSLKVQILLNSAEPYVNMVEVGSSVKTCKVYACRLCQMLMMATTQNRQQILLVMNNMLRRTRQGIMIPNAQESFAKKTPALSYYTLTKLHMTKSPDQ